MPSYDRKIPSRPRDLPNTLSSTILSFSFYLSTLCVLSFQQESGSRHLAYAFSLSCRPCGNVDSVVGRIFPCLASLDGIVSSAGVPVSPTISPSELTKACGQSQIDTAFLPFYARMNTQRHSGMDQYCGRSGEFMNVFDGATPVERGLSPQRKTPCVD